MMETKWRCGYVGYTAFYVLPYLRVSKTFAFVGWGRYEVGFWRQRKSA
jgi:hypothetical protein